MSLQFRETLRVAKRVLTEVNKQLKTSKDRLEIERCFSVETYGNCREHGFCITGGRTAVSFSEYRNSDDIVVYCGDNSEFDIQSSLPSTEVYQNRKMFRCGEFEKTAKFIRKILRSGIS